MIIPLALDGLPYRITFYGRIHPPGSGALNLTQGTEVEYQDKYGLYHAKMFPEIINSRITVNCFISCLFDDHINVLFGVAMDVVRSYVDLASFYSGTGTIILIDKCTDQDERTWSINHTVNPGICTSVDQGANYDKLLRILSQNPKLLLALDDLILSAVIQDHTVVNCARAVEGIRNCIAGEDLAEPRAWAKFHETLNTDKSYVAFITDMSRLRRHGKRVRTNKGQIIEAQRRSWIILDRYFHLQLRGVERLRIDEFPMLTG